jgi:hypothetical protein
MSRGQEHKGAVERPRVMRPYEWTHTDGQFRDWLRRQGLSEDNWVPPAWGRRE